MFPTQIIAGTWAPGAPCGMMSQVNRPPDYCCMSLMQEKKLEVQIETSFEEFMKWLQDEKQTFALDTGNIKLTYNSVSLASVLITGQ